MSKLAKFPMKILQQDCGYNSKGLVECLKEQTVVPDQTIMSFDVRALFNSVPVPIRFEVINRKFTEERALDQFLKKTCLVPTDNIISSLQLVLNNFAFSF